MSKKVKDAFGLPSIEDIDIPPILGLGKSEVVDDPVEDFEEESSGLPEQEAIDTIAQRIINVLREDESIKPKNWGDILRGLELVLKFKHELHGKRKKGEEDLAYQALQEFKEVVDAFSKFKAK